MPIELRFRIYWYLLPGKEVPANAGEEDQAATRDGMMASGGFGSKHQAYMSICRVNRQIHDEATGLLYGSSAFTIRLDEKGLRMCNSNSTTLSVTLPGVRPNHALQDYQMRKDSSVLKFVLPCRELMSFRADAARAAKQETSHDGKTSSYQRK